MNSLPRERSTETNRSLSNLMDFAPSVAVDSTPVAAAASDHATSSRADRPITRSLTRRNLQQQNEANTDPPPGLASDINNNNSAKILKMMHLKQLQLSKQQPLLTPQKTYQKIIINERPCNLINILEGSRLGRPLVRSIPNVSLLALTCFSISFFGTS